MKEPKEAKEDIHSKAIIPPLDDNHEKNKYKHQCVAP